MSSADATHSGRVVFRDEFVLSDLENTGPIGDASLMRVVAIVVLLSAGCGSSHNSKCSDAAKHVIDHMLELRALNGKPLTSDPDVQKANGLRSLLAERCSADEWTDDTVRCLNTASSAEEFGRCMSLLSELQLRKLENDPIARTFFGAPDLPDSKQRIAEDTVKKYAYEAYPSWSQAHPDRACPKKIDELNEYMNNKDTKDPWGNDYRMFCDATLPAGVKGLGVASSGEDGRPDTADDVKSW